VTKKIAEMIGGDAYIHVPVFFQIFQLLAVDFFIFYVTLEPASFPVLAVYVHQPSFFFVVF
jgi:hypothetical protein